MSSKYAQNVTLHRLQNADMQNMCTKYADICKKYTNTYINMHIHKICTKYAITWSS